ncbi:MAG: NAD(P)/FAD-dependent oxidoreductase [Herpetosiphonaceae bacterium]|nr:NAD(P)/FAD-dependent oxidoreductase [Herpetosiphonaceae bacterium]
MKRIAIIGAGFAGLSAAYDLANAGHQVTVFEAAPQVGGLAAGFRADGWDWPLEKFYHHIFQSDAAFLSLIKQIGANDLLFFNAPVSGQWDAKRGSIEIGGVLPLLRYPNMPFIDRVRTGMGGAWLKMLKIVNRWQHLEHQTAEQYIERLMGSNSYRTIWQPILEGKFGPYTSEVNAAWFWARIASRTFKLGYFRGGFQAIAERLADAVRASGADIRVGSPVRELQPAAAGWTVISDRPEAFDAVLSTTSPSLLRRMVPALPADYTAQLEQLKSLGAVVLTVALSQSLTNGMYWMNMDKAHFPYLALVEHTQMIDRRHYNGQHLVYLGDYLEPSHEYFSLTQEELLARFMPSLRRVNANFDPSWVQGAWLHRETYAQPIVPVGHSASIPALKTPLKDLWWASMSQVYPWDRGTNFAVEIGRRAAAEMLNDA